jgi:hypothetical protein
VSLYRFGRFGALMRDDHPLALYAGSKRLSPPPEIVLWFPWNWVLMLVFLPWALIQVWKERHQPKA